MSDYKNFVTNKTTYEEFVSVQHGDNYINLSIFIDHPTKSISINIAPKLAIKIANEIIKRANQIKEGVSP